MLKRGLFGMELRHQAVITGFLYVVIGLIGLIFGFILFTNPEKFVDTMIDSEKQWELRETKLEKENRMEVEKQLDEVIQNLKSHTDEATQTIKTIEVIATVEAIDSNDYQEDGTNVDLWSDQQYIDDDASNNEEFALDEEIPKYEDANEHRNNMTTSDDSKEDVIENEKPSLELGDYDTEDRDIEAANQTESKVETVDHSEESGEDSFSNLTSYQDTKTNTLKYSHFHQLIRYVENYGLEVIVASFLRLICSAMLVVGARNNREWLVVPWVVEECAEMLTVILYLFLQTAKNGSWSVNGVLMFIVIYFLGSYFVYSVASYHSLLRRMSKQSQEVISSVCQGGFQAGSNYQRLEDECWQMPSLPADGESGFRRESKVTVDETDDYVLYVK